MKNNKGFVGIGIIIAIIALLVIGGGVYVYNNNKKVEAPAVVDTGTQQSNTQTPPIDTQTNNSNWKTYTDNTFGFEVKYPSNWFQSIHGAYLVLASTNVLGGDPPTISIGSLSGYGKSRLEDIYDGNNERKIDFKKDCITINFAGTSAYKCLTDPDSLYPGTPIIFLLKNNISFEIHDNINDEISQQILSTFKFVNKNSSTTTNQPILTQQQAQAIVLQTWGGCTPDTCGSVSVTVQNNNGQYVVTATYEGLRDDSSSAQKKVAPAYYSNGVWTLGNATITQRCQSGRGHQDFSSTLCI